LPRDTGDARREAAKRLIRRVDDEPVALDLAALAVYVLSFIIPRVLRPFRSLPAFVVRGRPA
jgi:hypothetical protein